MSTMSTLTNSPSSASTPETPSLLVRLWWATPDWLFRALGVIFFLGCLASRVPAYLFNFWEMGPHYVFADGTKLQLPWTHVLIDMTMLLLGLSYLFRLPPKSKVSKFSDIAIALAGGFWPMLPIAGLTLLAVFNMPLAYQYNAWLWLEVVSLPMVLTGAGLIIVGNALDVSSYCVLFRSFSIVPEARQLVTGGPYRFVRHPVYLGQLIAQAGVWLIFARLSIFTAVFYAAFVVIQLYRSKLEERVLEKAFGEEYTEFKKKSFWFF